MTRNFIITALLLLSCGKSILHAQGPPPPPARISVPSMLATTATGKSLAGKPWEYVVWQTADPSWLRNRTLSLYVKAGSADAPTPYALVGMSRITTDPATLKVLLDRAKALSTDPEDVSTTMDAELTKVIDDLATRWKVGGETLPNTREGKLSALVNRALSSEEDAITLRQISTSYPAIRLALGLGWLGPLPSVGDGALSTIEVREYDPVGQRDIQIVGRVTFQAGRPAVLAAPGAPVQVIDVTPEGHFNVKLRWSVPDTLRRQILQTTGFVVWRYNSLPPVNPTPLEVASGYRLTRYPIALSKLFNATEASDLTADSTTFFAMDRGLNHVPNATVFTSESSKYYRVAALDWLGQIGPVSQAVIAHVVNTVPPPVPSDLKVEEIFSGSAAVDPLNFRLTFDGLSPDPASTYAHRFAVYRGAGNDAASLQNLNRLLPYPALPITPPSVGIPAIATFASANGRIRYNDLALDATTVGFSKSFWYSVRSIHDTAWGPNYPIYSAPSPPVFGTFHNHDAPAAPGGSVAMDSPVTLIQYVGKGAEGMFDGAKGSGNGRVLRMSCTRANMDVRYLRFHIVNLTGDVVLEQSPKIFFGNGVDEVYHDFFWENPLARNATSSLYNLQVVCTAYSSTGVPSFRQALPTALTWANDGGMSITNRTRVRFRAEVKSDSLLVETDANTAPRLEAPVKSSTSNKGDTVAITLNANTWNNSKAIIRIVRPGYATVVRLARVDANRRIFLNDPNLTTAGGSLADYQVRVRKDSQSPMPAGFTGETWLPVMKESGHTNANPSGGSNTASVSLQISSGAAEYRLYRQVDGGELGLIAEGPCDYSLIGGAGTQIVIDDKPNLPSAGRICYYGQMFDSEGNPSPLKQIGECISILADLPIPVLDTPEQLGTPLAPKMLVRWFAPKSGVRDFKVRVKDKATGLTLPNPLGGKKIVSALSDGIYFEKPLSGTTPVTSINGETFVTNASQPPSGAVPPPAEEPSLFTMTFDVKAEGEYTIDVTAVGWSADKEGIPSLPQKFTWRSVPASGSVPWPTRPLPPVIQGSLYQVQARVFTRTMALAQGPLPFYSADETPVFVRIGLIPLDPNNGFQIEPIQTSLPAAPVAFFKHIPVLNPDTQDKRYRFSRDPNVHIYNVPSPTSNLKIPVTPAVVYRQLVSTQGRDTSQTADMVQVSPLIQTISWLPRSGNLAGVVDQNVVAIPSYSGGAFDSATLGIADQHPILSNSTYRYFLVQFDATGEILQTIDAGTITTE